MDLIESALYQLNPLSLPHFVTAAIIAIVVALILYLEHWNRASRFFAGFSLLFVVWLSSRGILRAIDDPQMVVTVCRITYAVISVAIPLLFEFMMVFLHATKLRSGVVRYSWLLGITLAAASLTTPLVISGWREFSWGYEPRHGVLGYGMVAWIAVLIVLASADAYRAYAAAPQMSVERKRIGLFMLAMGALYTATVDFLAPMGIPVFPFAFVGVMVFTLLTAYVTWRYGLAEVSSQLAVNEIARMMRSAMLILDADGTIREANERAEWLLGVPKQDLAGKSARELLGNAFSMPDLRRLAGLDGREEELEFPFPDPNDGQVRELSLSASVVLDHHQRPLAYVCIVRDISARRQAERAQVLDSLTDALTRLHNRTMFLGYLDDAVKHHRSGRASYTLCLIAFDRMRQINQDLGYDVGDATLIEFASRLNHVTRAEGIAARIGDDEFAILLRGEPDTLPVRAFVRSLEESLRAPVTVGEHALTPSACIAVVGGSLRHGGGEEALRSASAAMLQLKHRSGVHFLQVGAVDMQQTQLEAELLRALAEGQLRVFYQPIVDVVSQRVAGMEALVRWEHPERGLLAPEKFLDAAERAGLMEQIDLLVFRQACVDLTRLRAGGIGGGMFVSVNLTESDLRAPGYRMQLEKHLVEHSLRPADFCLELSERTANAEPLRPVLEELRGQGFGIHIDDFGTGYSALSRLHQLPISAIKIDRDFVRAMSRSESAERIVGLIVAMANNLQLEVIAEGAATAAEVNQLQRLGCDNIQGFYFSRPVPFADLQSMLRAPQHLQSQIEELRRNAA